MGLLKTSGFSSPVIFIQADRQSGKQGDQSKKRKDIQKNVRY